MKCIEKIVKTEGWNRQNTSWTCFRLPTGVGKGVEDVTVTILNLIDTHLKKEKSHARILFVDFSQCLIPTTSLTTKGVIIWHWVEPSLSDVNSRLFAWETSESACERLFVRYSVYIHLLTSWLCPVSIALHFVYKWLQEMSLDQISFLSFLVILLL